MAALGHIPLVSLLKIVSNERPKAESGIKDFLQDSESLEAKS